MNENRKSEIPTVEEINRYIHTEIMEKCWHEALEKTVYVPETCRHCSATMYKNTHLPDYCSDDSPRSLLNKVVTHVVNPLVRMEFIVLGICPMLMELNLASDIHAVELNAEQIARACVAAHKENQ